MSLSLAPTFSKRCSSNIQLWSGTAQVNYVSIEYIKREMR
jgi:hypothetical protein